MSPITSSGAEQGGDSHPCEEQAPNRSHSTAGDYAPDHQQSAAAEKLPPKELRGR